MPKGIPKNKSTTAKPQTQQAQANMLVANAIRQQIMGGRGNKNMNDNLMAMYDTFGYRHTLEYNDYYRAYRRQGIAKRIIDATVDFSWKELPAIIDEDQNANKIIKDKSIGPDSKRNAKQHPKLITHSLKIRLDHRISNADEVASVEYTEFEEGVFQLFKNFPMLRLLKKADKLNCIGRYSIIVIGTKDGKLTEELAAGMSLDDIVFFNVYSEKQATVQTWETDKANPRYGLPKTYNIMANEDGGMTTSYVVHWTRVIHIAEDLLDSEVYGMPKLEAVFNELQDIIKVVGGSAEMFWLGAYQGIVFNVKDGYELTEENRNAMTTEIQNYVDKLQRFIKTKGVDVTTLSSPPADPRGNFEVLIKLISGASNIPTRILLGSEQGQLAAAVDQDTFFSYITGRRNSFINESILRQLIDRLVEYGYLPAAVNSEYFIEWPALFEQTKAEKLTNAKTMVETAVAAVGQGGTPTDLITPEEIRTAVGLPEEIPETAYPDIGAGGSMGFGEDEFDLLPEEDDTQDIADKVENEFNPSYEDYVDTAAVAKFFGVGNGTITSYAKYKGMPHYRLGSRYKFRMEEVENWMQEQNAPVEEDADE